MADRLRGQRRAAIGVVVIVAVLGAGTATWALAGGKAAAYRTSLVTRGSVTQTMTTTGTISPVHDAALDFQVAGTVGKVYAKQGSRVRSGQRLASLERGSLRSALRSARSTLASARAQLVSDENGQAAAASNSSSSPTMPASTPTPSPRKTGTPAPTRSSSPVNKQLVVKLHRDQATLITDQQQTDADLAAAKTALSADTAACAAELAGTGDGDSTASCMSATQASLTAQQTVATDQKAVGKAETVLNADLSTAIAAVRGTPSTGPTTGTTENAVSSDSARSADSASDAVQAESAVEVTPSPTAPSAAAAALRSSESSVTASTLAGDQAKIDAARASVATAKGDLAQATLRSPISGKVAAVTVAHGDKATGGASSSNPAVEIVGSRQTNVTIDVTAAQVRQLATGMAATVTPDGRRHATQGVVTLIGQATTDVTSGDTAYPVTIALSAHPTDLVSGADAQVAITLARLSNVLVVPTSAVRQAGTQASVEVYTSGRVRRVDVKVGAVGAAVTQVTSGLRVGTRVVLANLNAAVPSSSSNLLTDRGGLGSSTFSFNRSGGAGGGPVFSGPPPGGATTGGGG